MLTALRSRVSNLASRLSPRTTHVLNVFSYTAAGGTSVYITAYYFFATIPYTVCGSSMSPALSPNYKETRARDVVIASPWVLSAPRPLRTAAQDGGYWSWTSVLWPFRPWFEDMRRGDVVVLRKPHAPEETTIKRIVALPGDRVIRCRKRQQVNEKFARKCGFEVPPREVMVPFGHVWVEGDNWRDTFDSDDYGPVAINMVLGRASYIIWPWHRRGNVPGQPQKHAGKTRVVECAEPIEDVDDDWKELYDIR